MLVVKLVNYIGFYVYHRPYLVLTMIPRNSIQKRNMECKQRGGSDYYLVHITLAALDFYTRYQVFYYGGP